MALQHLPLNQIDQAQLQNLIDGRAPETQTIEYKRDTYGDCDSDRGEFLADISSFANTIGGDIVVGMAAAEGVPTDFAPLSVNPDAEILRLDNMARSGLQPRISNLTMRAVSLTGGYALLIRVPRSYDPPHRIIRQGKGHHRFYARSSAGKYEPNVDELRLLFTRAPNLADRLRNFRFDRVAKIAANEGIVPLLDSRALILHVVPFSAFDTRLTLPLGRNVHWYNEFPPLGLLHPSQSRINVDGLLTLSNAEANARAHRAYAQLFHSGIVEGVASSFLQGEGTPKNPYRLRASGTEDCIVQSSHIYLQALLALGCLPPFAVLVSLIGVKGIPYSFGWGEDAGILDRDQFHFSEAIIDDVPPDRQTYAQRLRPLLDETANAAGWPRTPSFDENGIFQLRRS